MGHATIILSFAVCLSLNVFLNSFDVYSDLTLTFNTLTFDLGDSLVLTGCRLCHRKEGKDVYSNKNRSCQPCLVKNYLYQCGQSSDMLNKINELEMRETCNDEEFSLYFNSTLKSYDIINEPCDDSNACCIKTNVKGNFPNSFKYLDKRALAYHTDGLREIINTRNKVNYDIYILSGTLSFSHCIGVYLNYFNGSSTNIIPFLNTRISKAKNQNGSEWYFKLTKTVKGNVLLQEGFDSHDECGFLIQNRHEIYVNHNSEKTCGTDSCLLHLQRLKYYMNISSLDAWKQETYYSGGVKSGGKTCQLLQQYGLASLVPILLNLTFHILLFLDDVKFGIASKKEAVFVLCLFYPQWKTLRFLYDYLRNEDENKLNKAKNDFDRDVGALEPFLESAFQVSLYFKILV